MAGFSIGKPIVIDGKEVIVVRDMVGTPASGRDAEVSSLVEPKGSDGRPPIYVAENELARLRENYPGMSVYGLWQILFYNDAVKYGGPYITFPLYERNGLFLSMLPDSTFSKPSEISHSGEYVDGFMSENPDYDPENAIRIDVDILSLKLPDHAAHTRVERSEQIRTETNRRWMVVSGLCGLIILATVAVNYGLSTVFKSHMADYSAKRSLIADLEDREASLASERLLERPDDQAVLDQLIQLFQMYPTAWTPTSDEGVIIGFKGTHLLITPPDALANPAESIAGAESIIQPDLSYKVTLHGPDEDLSQNLQLELEP
tara:strand:- start:79219 stop:80169 length:951 start_codon:yes stop_codon:yes gene_type:complete